MRSLTLLLLSGSLVAQTLPEGSRLIEANGVQYHVHEQNQSKAEPSAPTLILLSGPSGRWHSDSAWFALLQPLAAKHFKTIAIDRAGHGFGAQSSQSYREFGLALPTLLASLTVEKAVIVGFASANLALAHYVTTSDAQQRLIGILLIDPDALGSETVEFYATQANDFKNPGLGDYVRSGKYDARASDAKVKERQEAEGLVPEHLKGLTDWAFYEAVTTARTERERIVQRFAEVARYDNDVRTAAAIKWPSTVPTIVWDTDFEAEDIARNPDIKELIAWRENSSRWFSEQFGRCHRRSESRQHLATFAEPEALLNEIKLLANGSSCR
jgi:pimeloyl-ACP methyl ester carboxylesterase